jgi:hypothetical protein
MARRPNSVELGIDQILEIMLHRKRSYLASLGSQHFAYF